MTKLPANNWNQLTKYWGDSEFVSPPCKGMPDEAPAGLSEHQIVADSQQWQMSTAQLDMSSPLLPAAFNQLINTRHPVASNKANMT